MNANNNKISTPKTLMEAVNYFAVYENAHQFFVNVRWPKGVVCPRCGSTEANYNPKYRRFQCNRTHELRQFTVKTGTVMEDSPLGLDKWAIAFWLEVNAKNSISSCEVARALGVTQKSAWFMLHRCRHALHVGSLDKLTGEIECDETFIGGLAKNMHKDRRERTIMGTGGAGKAIVMGLLERHTTKKGHSRVVAKVIDDRQKDTLHDVIHQHVEKDAKVYTDECTGYNGLSENYAHDFINHAEAYVRGAVHTNGLENFWALFKRCIKGTHISVEPFHLAAYVESEAYRFNNRQTDDADRFVGAIQGISGKRLDYKTLIGKNDAESDSENGKGAASVAPDA